MTPEKHSHSSIHAHGDGTFHTHPPALTGPRMEHAHIGHALAHLAKMHSADDHMHVLGHEDGYTTHHVLEGGAVKGPHEHATMGALKKHMSAVMDNDGDEG